MIIIIIIIIIITLSRSFIYIVVLFVVMCTICFVCYVLLFPFLLAHFYSFCAAFGFLCWFYIWQLYCSASALAIYMNYYYYYYYNWHYGHQADTFQPSKVTPTKRPGHILQSSTAWHSKVRVTVDQNLQPGENIYRVFQKELYNFESV